MMPNGAAFGGVLLIIGSAVLADCPTAPRDAVRFVARVSLTSCEELSGSAADIVARRSLAATTRHVLETANGLILTGSVIEKVYYNLHTEDDTLYHGTEFVSQEDSWYYPDQAGGSCSELLDGQELYLLLPPTCCDESAAASVQCALGIGLARKPHSSLIKSLRLQ